MKTFEQYENRDGTIDYARLRNETIARRNELTNRPPIDKEPRIYKRYEDQVRELNHIIKYYEDQMGLHHHEEEKAKILGVHP